MKGGEANEDSEANKDGEANEDGERGPWDGKRGPWDDDDVGDNRERVEDLQDVTKITGVNLDDEGFLGALPAPVQYELTRERYHVSIPALRAQVEAIGTVSMARANMATTALIGRGRNVGPTPPASKNGLRAVRADVIDLLAIAVEQRLRDIVEELIAISKHRVELAKMGQEIEVTSNPKKQMWLIEKIRRDHAEVKAGIITPAQIAAAREQRDAAAAASTPRRPESLVMQHKVQLTNSTALKELGVRPRTTASPASAAGSTPDDDAGTPTPAAAATRQRRTRNPADQRKLTVRDLLFYLEHEPQSARSRMLARRYLLLRER